jgi:capsular polysaccharide biosynthesis protein
VGILSSPSDEQEGAMDQARKLAQQIVVVALVAVGVSMASLTMTPMYQSSAVLLVGWQQEEGSGEEIQTLEYREPPQALGLVYAIDSRPVAKETIQRLGLEQTLTPAKLADKLSVEPVENTQFIRLSYEDTDPVKATRIVNTAAQVASEFISERSSGLTATVWEKAAVPERPVSPHPWRNGLLTLAMGLVLSAMLTLPQPRPLAARVAGNLVGRPSRQGVGQAGVLGTWYSDHSIVERVKEKKLLKALGRCGRLSAVQAAMETGLTVDSVDRILSDLAHEGQLQVDIENGARVYSFWEHGA